MFILNPQSGIPIYRQVVEQVRRMVASGQLKPGDDLPSVRELAVEHAVNPMTISKAYSLLEVEGLLVRQRGKPMQIAVQASTDSLGEKIKHIQPQLEQLAVAAKQLELGYGDVIQALKKYLHE